MAKSHLKLVVPGTENGTVSKATPPRRVPNSKIRSREHLTEREITALEKAALKSNRWGHRDATMVMLAFRHGLRAAELVSLRWDQVDMVAGKIHVARVKNSSPSTQFLDGKELRWLKKLQREQPGNQFIFVSERGTPFTTGGFREMVSRLGVEAKMPFPIHPHMLRHSAGYKLVNDGVDMRTIQSFLGHKNIQHTVRYTELSPTKFRAIKWND